MTKNFFRKGGRQQENLYSFTSGYLTLTNSHYGVTGADAPTVG
jgi:hypothetical protein